jgi:hypothetical protein
LQLSPPTKNPDLNSLITTSLVNGGVICFRLYCEYGKLDAET